MTFRWVWNRNSRYNISKKGPDWRFFFQIFCNMTKTPFTLVVGMENNVVHFLISLCNRHYDVHGIIVASLDSYDQKHCLLVSFQNSCLSSKDSLLPRKGEKCFVFKMVPLNFSFPLKLWRS